MNSSYAGLIGRRKASNVATYRAACAALATSERVRIAVEVGVYAGGLSRLLAAVPTMTMLWVVDAWDEPFFIRKLGATHMNQVADEVIAWAKTMPNVTVLRMHSVQAAQYFIDESVDFFQTDGDHSLDGITSDLDAWIPKVRVGGIICGDNYEIPAVADTVDKYLPHREFGAKGRFWWARRKA